MRIPSNSLEDAAKPLRALDQIETKQKDLPSHHNPVQSAQGYCSINKALVSCDKREI